MSAGDDPQDDFELQRPRDAASATRGVVDPGETLAADAPDSSDALPTGQAFVGELREDRFQFGEVLGSGAMGIVLRAMDLKIGRPVAVKRLLDHGSRDAEKRFLQEVQTVGALDHPHIVPIYDLGLDPTGTPAFVMKCIEGRTVAEIIDGLKESDPVIQREFPLAVRLDVFVGVVKALRYAECHGWLHRDVKPANVMVGDYGEVWLMDWGLAKSLTAKGEAGQDVKTTGSTISGTPRYMSPEQAAGDEVGIDARSDLYSAFVMLYEMLTLQPYIALEGDITEILATVQRRSPPDVSDKVYDPPNEHAVPKELRYFLLRGLQPRKEDRFENGQVVLTELQRIRHGDFAIRCPVTLIKSLQLRLARSLDQRPRVTIFLLLFAATLCGMSFIGSAFWLFR